MLITETDEAVEPYDGSAAAMEEDESAIRRRSSVEELLLSPSTSAYTANSNASDRLGELSSPGPYPLNLSSYGGFMQNAESSRSANTSDEDDDMDTRPQSQRERRREAHTQAEQKRREAIKRGYETLQLLVPTCQMVDAASSQKISKASILQRSVDYIQQLAREKQVKQQEVDSLKKEVMALQILKKNYEEMLRHNRSAAGALHGANAEELKMNMFKHIAETLFESFDQHVSIDDFGSLSSGIIRWTEEYCKPQSLRDLCLQVITQEK